MKVTQHGLDKDWCHLCGKREHPSADIRYPENAEHDTENSRYIRICCDCAETIRKVALGVLAEQ